MLSSLGVCIGLAGMIGKIAAAVFMGAIGLMVLFFLFRALTLLSLLL